MKKIPIGQTIIEGGALVVSGILLVEGGLYFAERMKILDLPPEAYEIAPLGVGLAFLGYTTFALAGRYRDRFDPKKKVTTYVDTPGRSPLERKYTVNGSTGSLFASTIQTIFGGPGDLPDKKEELIVYWKVPYNGTDIVVKERELLAFVTQASKRRSHQFSRRYWVNQRKTPRPRYEAYMLLLEGSGLVELRQMGSSGFLVNNLKPHNALSYLKHESSYRA